MNLHFRRFLVCILVLAEVVLVQIIVPGGVGLGFAELEIIECRATASQSQHQQDHQTAHVGLRLFLQRFGVSFHSFRGRAVAQALFTQGAVFIDIEIYVDGIATMQIQNLNALVDTVRHEIIERYRPGEDDPHLKVLQAAHISDDEYFSHMVLDDLNLIIRDIREAHKKDSESAPQTTVADELKENLEAVENFKGSRDEKLVVLYCKQLGINYKNLSDEEFRWLIRILKKSKKMGTPISQRKKR